MNHESDASEKNLTGTAAVHKIREMVKSARVCLFGTTGGESHLTVRPMGVQEVDDEGNLWFLSGRSSIKNVHLARNPRVQLLFSNPGDAKYLSLLGTATISDDPALRKKYWNSLAKAWFHGGVDDPELTVIQIRPDGGHYWDTEHGKAVSLLKIAIGAITGKTMDGGVQGGIRP